MSDKVKVPKVLYHYCSLETFCNIIKNKSIWLSDLSRTNDSKELIWLKEIVKREVVPQIQSQKLEEHGGVASAPSEWKLADVLLKYASLQVSCWGFCLSGRADSLGQWRGYGDDGAGIAIGFDGEKLDKMLPQKEQIESDDISLTLMYVNYGNNNDEDSDDNNDNNDNGRKIIEELKKEAAINIGAKREAIENLVNDLRNKQYPEAKISETVAQIIVMELLSMKKGPFYKMNAFRDEDEWRIVYSMPRAMLSEKNLKDYGWPSGLQFNKFDFNDKFVSHLDIGFTKMKDVIKSITIGPKSKLTEQDIELILRWNGVYSDSIEIKKSEASYR